MKFGFNSEGYNILKSIDFSEMGDKVRFSDEENTVYINEKDLREFRGIIEDEIVMNGMTDDQEEVTPYGRDLYSLHDSFYID